MLAYRTSPSSRRRGALAVVAAMLSLALSACMLFARPPKDVDYARTRTSAAGLYRGTIRPQGDSIPQGRMHRWTLHLENSAGQPIEVAQIVVDGGMPQHGHGLPTKPRVTRHLGAGDHVVEGMKFNMGGWWVVTFRVSASAGQDSLTFNLKI